MDKKLDIINNTSKIELLWVPEPHRTIVLLQGLNRLEKGLGLTSKGTLLQGLDGVLVVFGVRDEIWWKSGVGLLVDEHEKSVHSIVSFVVGILHVCNWRHGILSLTHKLPRSFRTRIFPQTSGSYTHERSRWWRVKQDSKHARVSMHMWRCVCTHAICQGKFAISFWRFFNPQ